MFSGILATSVVAAGAWTPAQLASAIPSGSCVDAMAIALGEGCSWDETNWDNLDCNSNPWQVFDRAIPYDAAGQYGAAVGYMNDNSQYCSGNCGGIFGGFFGCEAGTSDTVGWNGRCEKNDADYYGRRRAAASYFCGFGAGLSTTASWSGSLSGMSWDPAYSGSNICATCTGGNCGQCWSDGDAIQAFACGHTSSFSYGHGVRGENCGECSFVRCVGTNCKSTASFPHMRVDNAYAPGETEVSPAFFSAHWNDMGLAGNTYQYMANPNCASYVEDMESLMWHNSTQEVGDTLPQMV